MRKRKLGLFCLFALAMLLSGDASFSQEKGKEFSITPFFQEITLGQGQKEAVFSLTVRNTTDTPATFRISVLDFGALDESGGVAFLGAGDPERKYGLASWMNLEKDAIVLNPGEKQNIRVLVENKESLSPGGHYAAVFFKMENDKSSSGGNAPTVAFKPSFASLIFARKLGGEIYKLELKGQELQKRFLGNPFEAKLRFQNTGNVHIVPRGVVKIADPFGREISRGIINTGSTAILPETFRIFPVPLKETAAAFIPGRYSMSIDYRYDGQDNFSSEGIKIFLVPPLFVSGIFILLAVAIVYFIFIGKIKIGNGIFNRKKRWL